MAAQLATLLTRSDLAELREVVRRWIAEAPTAQIRKQFEVFAAKLIELKHALAEQATQPTQQELELALTMMLGFAAQAPPAAGQSR